MKPPDGMACVGPTIAAPAARRALPSPTMGSAHRTALARGQRLAMVLAMRSSPKPLLTKRIRLVSRWGSGLKRRMATSMPSMPKNRMLLRPSVKMKSKSPTSR
ncbi:hypothetical protein D3C86_1548590 [compost metagenome]